jgi:hypothetical protein
MIFHLQHADQELVFGKVGAALNPGGQFLFTETKTVTAMA